MPEQIALREKPDPIGCLGQPHDVARDQVLNVNGALVRIG